MDTVTNINIEEKDNYREFLEKLKVEIGDFIRLSESVKSKNDYKKVRKNSISLRNNLKRFREISLNSEKEMNRIIEEAKQKIKESNIN